MKHLCFLLAFFLLQARSNSGYSSAPTNATTFRFSYEDQVTLSGTVNKVNPFTTGGRPQGTFQIAKPVVER